MADENTTKVTPETEPPAGGSEGGGGNAEGGGGDAKEEKKDTGKVEFPMADAQYKDGDGNVVTAVNADGVLIAVPKPIRDAEGKVLYKGYNVRKHLPLKKDNFAGIVEYILYQAFVARVRAAILVKSAEDKEKKASRISKFGDDQTRRKVNKLAKMKEAIESLQKQLEEDGVDLDDI